MITQQQKNEQLALIIKRAYCTLAKMIEDEINKTVVSICNSKCEYNEEFRLLILIKYLIRIDYTDLDVDTTEDQLLLIINKVKAITSDCLCAE